MHYCGTIRIVFRAMLIPASGTFNVSCPEGVFCQFPPFVPHFHHIGGGDGFNSAFFRLRIIVKRMYFAQRRYRRLPADKIT